MSVCWGTVRVCVRCVPHPSLFGIRLRSALFNHAQITRELEHGYQAMWDVRLARLAPPPPNCPPSSDPHAHFASFRACVIGWEPMHILVSPRSGREVLCGLHDRQLQLRVEEALQQGFLLLQVTFLCVRVCVCLCLSPSAGITARGVRLSALNGARRNTVCASLCSVLCVCVCIRWGMRQQPMSCLCVSSPPFAFATRRPPSCAPPPPPSSSPRLSQTHSTRATTPHAPASLPTWRCCAKGACVCAVGVWSLCACWCMCESAMYIFTRVNLVLCTYL